MLPHIHGKFLNMLCSLQHIEENNGATINWKSLYEKTINHDFAEIFIGDIKTPVKHASPELKQMLSHVEEKMMEKFIFR